MEDNVLHIIFVKVPDYAPGSAIPSRVYCEDSYCSVDYVL